MKPELEVVDMQLVAVVEVKLLVEEATELVELVTVVIEVPSEVTATLFSRVVEVIPMLQVLIEHVEFVQAVTSEVVRVVDEVVGDEVFQGVVIPGVMHETFEVLVVAEGHEQQVEVVQVVDDGVVQVEQVGAVPVVTHVVNRAVSVVLDVVSCSSIVSSPLSSC